MQCTYPRQSPARLYLLDTGTRLVALAHDTWPAPAERDRGEQHMSTIAKLQAALTVEPQDTDELVAKSGLTQRDVVEALGALEITGAETVIVEAVPGRRDADGDSSSAPDSRWPQLNGTPRRWKWLVSRGLS